MKIYKLLAFLTICLFISIHSCKDIYEQELYQKPDWLTGKLYTQLETQDNLSLFAECLRITGYDSLLNKSGSFSIFAPTNEAIEAYLIENQYTAVKDIPLTTLNDLVKFHIIQDAWSLRQLQSLDKDGWIDPNDPESEPQAYKRQTLLRNPDQKYWVERSNGEDVIVFDSLRADRYKKVYTRSRKYVPIYFDDFFGIYDLDLSDYEFYFGRPYEPGNIFYANGKVLQDEIFAENGFIFIIDQVVKPMLNAEEMMEREFLGESYSEFLKLIYQFPEFKTNLEETNDQPEARAGMNFDTLYDLSFPRLPFDLHEELTGPSLSNPDFTYYRHNGVYVPTDESFQSFLNDIVLNKSGFPHWPNYSNVPIPVKQIIVQTHFTNQPVYPSDMAQGFEDGDGNIIYLSKNDVVRMEFGSNCTFMGLNKTIVPRAFSSVTGPVYLRPGYSLFMYAIEKAKVLPAFTTEDAEYCFFPIPDNILALDSSLMINWINIDLNRYSFSAFDRSRRAMVGQSTGLLAKRLMNQIGITLPNNSADKEFIETLGGGYLIWNNVENSIQGSLNNTFGYKGDSLIYYEPTALEEVADNGTTYSVESWFKNTTASMYSRIYSDFPEFLDLLEQAGLFDNKLYRFSFLVEGESYTIFIPTNEALAASQIDTLAPDELSQVLRYHFVKGDRIFTDNKKLWKNYETLRRDESSTPFTTYYSGLNIRPGRDLIEILDSNGDVYVSIPESEDNTNLLIAYDTDQESDDEQDWVTTSVVHRIDSVLHHSLLH